MFADRRDAGRRLAVHLERFRDDDPIVTGLPRGGVVVADEVAAALHAPLDVIVVRKVGAPPQPELAMGAVGEGGTIVWNEDVLAHLPVTPEMLDVVVARAREQVDERVRRYRQDAPAIPLLGRCVLVVDDGLATGATARAAAQVAAAQGASRVVIAVPVAAPATMAVLERVASEVLAVEVRPDLRAVGMWYRDFDQVSDDEVVAILRRRKG